MPDDVLHVQLRGLHPPPDLPQPLRRPPVEGVQAKVVRYSSRWRGRKHLQLHQVHLAPAAQLAEQDAHAALLRKGFPYKTTILFGLFSYPFCSYWSLARIWESRNCNKFFDFGRILIYKGEEKKAEVEEYRNSLAY